MKNTKRFLALLLAVVMVIGMVPSAAAMETTTESAPTESTPTESTPTESTPTESTPTESTPTESTPTESTPTESTPTESTPTESTPTESTPTESTPTESTPTESTPTESTPTESTPTESTPTESTPTESTPTESTPAESTPTESTPVEEETKSAYLIKGAKLYKDYTDAAEEPKVIDKWNTEIKIGEPITAEDGTTWYKFTYSNLLAELFNGYSYVKAADVVTDKCTCDAEENEHAAGCALYTHVPTSEVTVGDGNTVSVAGAPEDAALQIADPDEDALDTVLGIVGAQYGGASTFSWGRSVPTPQRRTETVAGELFAYDISILNADGTEWQPGDEPVTVTLNIPDLEVGVYQKIVVAHMHGEEVTMIEPEVDAENDTITFTTDGFSVFYGFIVDFEFNGKTYGLSGNGEIYLSELMTALEIGYSINDVESIEFTDSSLISITEETGDWVLKSLKSFSTEEYLDIYFNDGEIISILVTDPVLKYYLTGTNWNMGVSTDQKITPSGVSTTLTCTTNAIDLTTGDFTKASKMVVYMRPGMALKVDSGTSWPVSSWKATEYNNGTYDYGIWTWIWDGTDNYAVTENVATVQTATFPIKVGNHVCEVTLILIPTTTNVSFNGNESPVLLADALASDTTLGGRYELKKLPTTLYNYDGLNFNKQYDANGTPYFSFHGTNLGKSTTEGLKNRVWTTSGKQMNGGGSVALMGIVNSTLHATTKLPVMAGGQDVDLFSETEKSGVKEVYKNVGFEFIYDNQTGYYTYNSALNHAQFFESENAIKLYRQSLSPQFPVSGASHTYAGFYPFTDINEAFLHSGSNNWTLTEWADKLDDAYKQYQADFAKDVVATSSTEPASTVDLNFGLKVQTEFYLPKGKQVDANGDGTMEDIVYEFTGDDDLWVFIDNQLVLDIGGGHTEVSGSINFTTGKVWVEKYTKMSFSGNDCNVEAQGTDLYLDFDFEEDAMHTMRIFYLERHSGVSNCRMRFNIPIVPSESVTVKKNLVNHEGLNLSVTPDETYTFQLLTRDTRVVGSTFAPYTGEGKTYKLNGTGNPIATNSDGKFTLKAGEFALFENIDRFTEVKAVEIRPDETTYKYTDKGYLEITNGTVVKFNDDYTYGEKTVDDVIIELDNSITFDFTNKMYTQPLKIQKNVIGGADALNDPNQAFTFTLDFTKTIKETATGAIKATKTAVDDTSLTDGGTFTLKHGESITIPRVPVNMTYDLKEDKPADTFDNPVLHVKIGSADETVSEWEFNTNYSGTIGEQTSGVKAINLITVDNQQRFNLTITKKIIDEDGSVITTAVPDQSFKFEITGVTDPTFKTTVLISAKDFVSGQASVTVKGLRAGEYQVKEITAWSSRYTLKTANNVTVTGNAPDASFSNYRTENKWLDFENLVENVFNAKTATE